MFRKYFHGWLLHFIIGYGRPFAFQTRIGWLLNIHTKQWDEWKHRRNFYVCLECCITTCLYKNDGTTIPKDGTVVPTIVYYSSYKSMNKEGSFQPHNRCSDLWTIVKISIRSTLQQISLQSLHFFIISIWPLK